MTVIDSLYDWLKTCSLFEEKRLDIDCLQSDSNHYSLDAVPCERIVKRYLDGSSVRRQLFTISSRAPFGPDITTQSENLQFFDDLESWLEEQAERGLLPDLGENRRARSLTVLSSSYPVEADEGQGGGTARYQIQLELIYLQNALNISTGGNPK